MVRKNASMREEAILRSEILQIELMSPHVVFHVNRELRVHSSAQRVCNHGDEPTLFH